MNNEKQIDIDNLRNEFPIKLVTIMEWENMIKSNMKYAVDAVLKEMREWIDEKMEIIEKRG